MIPPTTPLTSRMRQLGLDALPRTGRSADSGYGSVETSPTKPPPKRRSNRKSLSLAASLGSESLQSYDGTGSEVSDSERSDTRFGPEIFRSPSVGPERFATLPRAARRRISRTDSYPAQQFDRPTYHHPRHGSDTNISSSRASSLGALDRFVPLRDHSTPGSAKLRTTRPLEELTPSERLVRHNQDAPDPFCFRRRPLPPSPTETRKSRRPSQGRTVLDSASRNQSDRRVSNSIWSVGGMAPNQGAVDDGRGGRVQSGTNAPMFHSLFPPSKPRAQEDVEKHEARLASAFDID